MTTIKMEKALPVAARLLRSWRGSNVLISGDSQRIIISKINPPKKGLLVRLKKAGRMISEKDIQDAIDWARK
ncbi:MAG: hypothetical protein AAB429_03690 [Patescibacteria group bacterium]